MADVSLYLNWNRVGVAQQAYGISRPAGAIKFSEFNANVKTETNPGDPEERGKYIRADMPNGIWREPNTGVIMLKPNILYEDWITNSDYDDDKLFGSDLDFANWSGGSPIAIAMPGYRAHVMERAEGEATIEELAVHEIKNLLDDTFTTLKSAIRTTRPLAINEGFGLHIHPRGLSFDQSGAYVGIHFGTRFFIVIRLNGTAEFWERVTDDRDVDSNIVSGGWVHRRSFSFKSGGVNHLIPFKIDVIPFGEKYLCIQFTNTDAATSSLFFPITLVGIYRPTSWLINTEKWGRKNRSIIPQKLKEITPAAPMVICTREDFLLNFRAHVIRYNFPAYFTLAPEPMGYPRPTAPTFVANVIDGMRSDPFHFGCFVTDSFVNEKDQTWDETRDTQVVAKITMNPSQNFIYSPELWSVDYKAVPSYTETEYDIIDLSDKWVSLNFERAIGLDSSRFTIRANRDNEFTSLFLRGGPVMAIMKTADEKGEEILFEGFVTKRLPTETLVQSPSGTAHRAVKKTVVDELTGYDLWYALNNTPVQYEVALDGRTVAEVLSTLIGRFFHPSEIESDGTLDELEAIEFFEDPKQMQVFNQDAKIGDAIREIANKYGIQDRPLIRIRRVEGIWKLGFGSRYFGPDRADDDNPQTVITKFFFLDDTLIPLYGGAARNDIQRWNPSLDYGTEQYFFIHTQPEITPDIPRYNAAIYVDQEGTSDDPERTQCVIPAATSVLTDPTKYDYEGIERGEVIGPPEIHTLNDDQLQRQGRFHFDQTQSGLLKISFSGEWQPGRADKGTQIRDDDLIMIVGRDDNGVAVSYGAYRIKHIEIDIDTDSAHRRHNHKGNYTTEYVGITDDERFPMFSGAVPLIAT